MKSVATIGPLLDEDYRRLLTFRNELRGFLRWSEQAAEESDLTPSLHQLLLVVRGHAPGPGPTIGQAAEALHVRHHSAVELARRAETARLVVRERDPLDQRRAHLKLTARGRQQLEVLTRAHLPRIQSLAETLDEVVQGSRVRRGS
jgi:DNA-binding MarR family transcriptional regulator